MNAKQQKINLAYAAELERYSLVLREASRAVGLRKDAAAYLNAEADRLERECAGWRNAVAIARESER